MTRPIFHTFLLFATCCAMAGFSGEAPVRAGTPAGTSADKKTPAFPLTSPHFAEIEDSVEMPFDGTAPDATFYNTAAMLDIIPALQNCTQEQLKAGVDTSATFRKIFNHPQDYRGHVVQFESTIKFIYENPEKLKDAQGNIIPLTRGHAITSYNPLTYLSLEPLPAGMKLDDPVLITGVFLQRFAYENRNMPGRELSWTPLIVCKKLERMAVKDEAPTSNAFIIGDIVFAMVAVGLLLLYANRQSHRLARNNVFTRMKKQRGGDDRLFPGPSGDFKKK